MKKELFLKIGGYIELILGISHIASGLFPQPIPSISAEYFDFLNLAGSAIGILLATMGAFTLLLLRNGNAKSIENLIHCQSVLWVARFLLELRYPVSIPMEEADPGAIVITIVVLTMMVFLISSIFTFSDKRMSINK